MECNGSQLRPLRKKFIRISAQATVNHIKKFVAKKLHMEGCHQVGIEGIDVGLELTEGHQGYGIWCPVF